MGCIGSKSTASAVKETQPKEVPAATITPSTEANPAASSPVEAEKTVQAAATADSSEKKDAEGESLVPKHHIDQFGNKIDDVTGGRVWSEAYYRARKDADTHAKLRGDCFDKSKKAFEEGNKKEAKELSDAGKQHGLQMEEANQRAVDEILKPQNLENAQKIDLHGLLVTEAVDATRKFVNAAITAGKYQTLEIITGAGHHSAKEKGPVIKPAIIEMCKEEKWQLDAAEDNEGSFILTLPSK